MLGSFTTKAVSSIVFTMCHYSMSNDKLFYIYLLYNIYSWIDVIFKPLKESPVVSDLRSAINMLQFSLLSSDQTFTLSSALEATLNDDMFHMLGRLLYAKREVDFESFDTDINLSAELRRPHLERDVNDIIEMTKAPAEVVLCFLHEHEPRFSPSLIATRKFLDTLSFCDSVCDTWGSRFTYMDEYAVQTLIFRTIPYYIILSSHLNNSQFSVVSYINRPFTFSWQIGRASWEQKIRHQVTYRSSQAQLMRTQLQKASQSQNIRNSDDENEHVLIEDSSDDASHDSFDDPVEFC
uniref:RGS domain-containing protein n=1 Tax=Heterorhabditis bacteriophora TaxID=37862 RepID=A0A1I7WY36_HETBA